MNPEQTKYLTNETNQLISDLLHFLHICNGDSKLIHEIETLVNTLKESIKHD